MISTCILTRASPSDQRPASLASTRVIGNKARMTAGDSPPLVPRSVSVKPTDTGFAASSTLNDLWVTGVIWGTRPRDHSPTAVTAAGPCTQWPRPRPMSGGTYLSDLPAPPRLEALTYLGSRLSVSDCEEQRGALPFIPGGN